MPVVNTVSSRKLTPINSDLLRRTVTENVHRGENFDFLDIRMSDPTFPHIVISGCLKGVPDKIKGQGDLEREADVAFRYASFDHSTLFTDGFGSLTLHSVKMPFLGISCRARSLAITGETFVDKGIHITACSADEITISDVSTSYLKFSGVTAKNITITRSKISGDLLFTSLQPDTLIIVDKSVIVGGKVFAFLTTNQRYFLSVGLQREVSGFVRQ